MHTARKSRTSASSCSIEGCGLPSYSKGYCKSCYNKERYKARKEHIKANVRRWKTANPERVSASNRKSNTGHTSERVDLLRDSQGGLCAMPDCRRKLRVGGAAHSHRETADHCHATNRPRGLLCHTCNVQLGFYERNKHRHEVFAAYVEGPWD